MNFKPKPPASGRLPDDRRRSSAGRTSRKTVNKFGPAHLTAALMLMSAASVIGGSALRDAYSSAPLAGWSAGLLFLFAAAFAASRAFSDPDDD